MMTLEILRENICKFKIIYQFDFFFFAVRKKKKNHRDYCQNSRKNVLPGRRQMKTNKNFKNVKKKQQQTYE